MERFLAICLVAASVAVLAFTCLPGCQESPGEDGAPAARIFHDAPLGLIPMELVPLKVPEPWETREDSSARPYHLLLRLLRFDDLSPYEGVATEDVQVPGAQSIRALGQGSFLVEGIPLGAVPVKILRELPEEMITDAIRHRPNLQKAVRAERNPVVLARHAITTCDVVVIDKADLQQKIAAQGLVADRFTLEPMAGVVVYSGDGQEATTDERGRFSFPNPMTVGNLLTLSFDAAGYLPLGVSAMNLSPRWVERLRDTGEAVFTLRPE